MLFMLIILRHIIIKVEMLFSINQNKIQFGVRAKMANIISPKADHVNSRI